jgi:threonylcarbamoyladenosine tRNA methylthiotransferase MtaB
MKRRYAAARLIQGVKLLRHTKSDPFIAADLITGFPAETPQEHSETIHLIHEAGFAALHVFPFSPRPGTGAAKLRPVVPQRVRDQRARELGGISRILQDRYARGWLGREVEVLIEGGAAPSQPPGSVHGVSANYLKVMVEGTPVEENPKGKIVRACLTGSGEICRACFLGFV